VKNLKHMMVLILIGAISTTLSSQPLPEVIGLTKITFKSGVNELDYANSIKKLNTSLLEHGKGIYMMLMKGDRGERKNQWLQAWGFELKCNRDYYFPTADAETYPQFGALLTEMPLGPNETQLEGERVYTDYVAVGYHELLNPMAGGIIAMREIEVIKGKEKAFEKYVINKLHPEFQKFIEGMNVYVYKGDRGERKDKYLLIYTFDTLERRNKYFPVEGEGGSEEYNQAARGMVDFTVQLEEMVDSLSSTGYTDYIMIH